LAPSPLSRSCDLRDLRSFPTRRSSDLSLHRQKPPCLAVNYGCCCSRSLTRSAVNSVISCFAGIASGGGVPSKIRRSLLFSHKKSDRKSTRLNSSHVKISYAVFCLKKKI